MSVAFDTLKFARALQGKAGLTAEQAEGIAEAFADATGEQLSTKADLREGLAGLDSRFASIDSRFANIEARFASVDLRFAKVDGELVLLKWMVGFDLALTLAVLFLLLRH
jgi:hypothetical protein